MAGRRQHVAAVAQGLVQVPGRVQHVGGDDQVVAVGVESLGQGVLLDVQDAIFDGGFGAAEAGFRLGEETGGDVRVDVVEATFGKLRQHRCGGRPGAGADLQYLEPPVFRQRRQQRLHGIGQHAVGRTCHRGLEIQVGRTRLTAAEQQRERVGLAAQDLRQGTGRAPEQADLRRPVGIRVRHPVRQRLGVVGQFRGQRLVGPHQDLEPIVRFLEDTRLVEHFQQPPEQALVFVEDIQLATQLLGDHYRARLAAPAESIQGAERETPGKQLEIGEQLGACLGTDPFGIEVVGEHAGLLRHGRRARQEVRRHDPGSQRAIAPDHLVEQVIQAFDGGEQCRPRRPLDRVAVQAAKLDPVRVVDLQVAGNDLRRGVGVAFIGVLR